MITALDDVPVVSELCHEGRVGAGGAIDAPTGLGGRPGQADTGVRGDDDMERWFVVRLRCCQRRDEVDEFYDGAGPSVERDERDGVTSSRLNMDEVDRFPVDL